MRDQQYVHRPSNVVGGTTPADLWRLTEDQMMISVESVGMCGTAISVDAAPSGTHIRERSGAQPAVIASLRRSLRENADIWAELAEH